MKIKKPLIKIIQVGTLFVFTSLSFLGMISFSNPEITSFWTVSSLHVSSGYNVYADDDEEGGEDEDEDDENETSSGGNQSVDDSVPSGSSGSSPTCQTTTETVYDTVTSASGTTSRVPRTVTKKVCSDGTSTTTSKSSKSSSSSSTQNNCTSTYYCADTVSTSKTTPETVVPPVVQSIGSNLRDGNFTGTGKYNYGGGSVDYSVELTLVGGKVVQAKILSFMDSGNGLYKKSQAESELSKLISTQNSKISVVSGASGTSKAIQDAVDNALENARKMPENTQSGISLPVETPKVTTQVPLQTQAPVKKEIKKEDLQKRIEKIFSKLSSQEKQNKLLSLKKIVNNLIDTTSFKILTTSDTDKISLLEEKLSVYLIVEEVLEGKLEKTSSIDQTKKQETKTYSFKALNGKTYTIIDDGSMVSIKKEDGSFAKQTFKTYTDAVAYLNQNAVNQKKVVTTPKKVKKVVAKVSSSKKSTTSPTVKTPTVPTVVTTKPKVDTTTKAS